MLVCMGGRGVGMNGGRGVGVYGGNGGNCLISCEINVTHLI